MHQKQFKNTTAYEAITQGFRLRETKPSYLDGKLTVISKAREILKNVIYVEHIQTKLEGIKERKTELEIMQQELIERQQELKKLENSN